MGPRPPRPASAPAVAPAKRPVHTLVVERRSLDGAERPRLKPKPDAAAHLREVASVMQNLPRDCFRDPAELVTLMRRLAGRLIGIAETGLVEVPAHRTSAPRQPFLARGGAGARAAAESVFGYGARGRRDEVGTVTSRKGHRVRVEVRRARSAGQMELGV